MIAVHPVHLALHPDLIARSSAKAQRTGALLFPDGVLEPQRPELTLTELLGKHPHQPENLIHHAPVEVEEPLGQGVPVLGAGGEGAVGNGTDLPAQGAVLQIPELFRGIAPEQFLQRQVDHIAQLQRAELRPAPGGKPQAVPAEMA